MTSAACLVRGRLRVRVRVGVRVTARARVRARVGVRVGVRIAQWYNEPELRLDLLIRWLHVLRSMRRSQLACLTAALPHLRQERLG